MEEFSARGWRELAHLETGDLEAGLVDVVDDLSSVHVHVRLNQRECRLFRLREHAPSEHIAVVSQLELAREDVHDGAEKESVRGNVRAGHALEEHLARLEVKLKVRSGLPSR